MKITALKITQKISLTFPIYVWKEGEKSAAVLQTRVLWQVLAMFTQIT